METLHRELLGVDDGLWAELGLGENVSIMSVGRSL